MAGILVVEDQGDIANLVRMHVEMLGHRVQCCDTLAFARRALAGGDWELLVLDLSLPDGDGLDLCRELRRTDASLPILMLTARATEHERVQGLETGADDYLTKPFGVLELQARVRALLRRAALAEPGGGEQAIEIPPLRLDPARREVCRGERTLDLTATEFDLLLFLARRPGIVFSRQQLLSEVWGYHHQGYEHTVNSHVNRLRAKIEQDPTRPQLIRTVWGVGYKLEATP
ncbi:MAG: response regulator transcription factor [Rhodocyclaceae bacterium]|nr:response regulator transcription factor [Rhodocyclaceae bacterium]